MTAFRAMALTLALGLLAACDAPPKPPAPIPVAPKTESAPSAAVAPAAPVEPARPTQPVLAGEAPVLPAEPPQSKVETRAAPPDKAPLAAQLVPGSAEKLAAQPQPEQLPPMKLDLRLPDELVQRLEPGEPLKQLPEQESLLPPMFVEKPAGPGPFQLNGRLITNDKVDDYWDSVEGAELQIEFRN